MDLKKASREELVSELGKALVKINALKLGTFTNPQGEVTPYFIDLRTVPSFPDAFSVAYRCLEYSVEQLVQDYRVEAVCGVPVSGLIMSSVLAHGKSLPLFYPVNEPSRGVGGYLRPGTNVLIVDDVSETGNALKNAILDVRSSGGEVSHALTIIDRSEGATKVLEKLDVKLIYFVSIEELYSTLKNKMAITEEQEEAIGGASEGP